MAEWSLLRVCVCAVRVRQFHSLVRQMVVFWECGLIPLCAIMLHHRTDNMANSDHRAHTPTPPHAQLEYARPWISSLWQLKLSGSMWQESNIRAEITVRASNKPCKSLHLHSECQKCSVSSHNLILQTKAKHFNSGAVFFIYESAERKNSWVKQTLRACIGLTLYSKQWQIETGKEEPPSEPLVHTAHTSLALREVDAESESAKEKQCGFFFFPSENTHRLQKRRLSAHIPKRGTDLNRKSDLSRTNETHAN